MTKIRERTERFESTYLSRYATRAEGSGNRAAPELPCEIRTCFQRDVDRITHSKSFRRLKHKTQVFFKPSGDHYRTRLTHTLEVCRIARTIARALLLNEDLVEAAALGHDLGHTPFGHSGEAMLSALMTDGFRHNEQSLRVVRKLERSGNGLNLCFEVEDAILRHTGDVEASTLEGKIIKYADRIAYINHDIDDAVRGGVLTEGGLPSGLVGVLGRTYRDRINTMVTAVVEESMDKPDILMLPDIREAMMEMRAFLFEAVYQNSRAKDEEDKSKRVLESLFIYYTRYPERLPEGYAKTAEEEGVERAVCDYISGMTDTFAVNKFVEIFVPTGWNI